MIIREFDSKEKSQACHNKLVSRLKLSAVYKSILYSRESTRITAH